MLDPDIGILIVAAMAMLLTGASLHKWGALAEFEVILAAYRLLPDWALPHTARFLPALELAIATGLVVPITRRWSALIGALLLLTYGSGIAINLWRKRLDLDCGCAGPGDRRSIAPWMVVRNLLLAVSLAVVTLPWKLRPLEAPDVLTLGGGLAVLVLLYLAVDRLLGQVLPRGASIRRHS
jgi:hypothetical protein